MAEKYKRPTVGGWLTPTLLAPWISVYGAITAITALGIDRGLLGKAVAWTVMMAVGSVWTFVFCLMLVAVDVSLLAVKVRTLPAGKRGWLASLVAPLACGGIYSFMPWRTLLASGIWGIAAALLIPMFLVAIVVRVFTGQKPPR
jgi:uncharacterized membrane protein YhaH (DUF805 family)